jgi:Lrp/AsnC family leucine-responsive transcriptional regulator
LWRLDLDGRIPLTELAGQVGLSKQALNYRLKKLNENRYILGHIAIIDIHRLGLLTYRLYLRLAATSPSKSDQLIEHLKKHKNTLFVGSMAGSWDAEAVFTVRNFIHFNEIVKDLKSTYGKSIYRSDLSMTPVVYLFRRDYLVSKTRKYAPLASYGFEPVPPTWDDLDFGILDALSTDCRVTYDELADRLGSSSQTVKKRIKKLEEDQIIRGYRTKLNTELLGRVYVKALLELAPLTRKREHEFYVACARYSFVVYLTEVLGRWQLEVEAEVEKMSELDDMIQELRSEFPGVIVDFDTVTVTKEHKLNYLPSGKTTKEIIQRPAESVKEI